MAVDEIKPFEDLNSILSGEYWLSNIDREKYYNPGGINQGLSQHLDCILHLNEINQWGRYVNKKMHYDYLFYSIRKMKRPFKKWSKKFKNEDVALVSGYFKINKLKAEKALEILSESDIIEIRDVVARNK